MNCNEIGFMLDGVDPRERSPAQQRAIKIGRAHV